MTEKFTAGELRAAAGRLGYMTAAERVLTMLPQQHYEAEQVMAVARTSSCGIAMDAVLTEARWLREPSIASDDDVLTVRELREWQKRQNARHISPLFAKDVNIDGVIRDIVSHREPEYPEGTVVRDSDGKGNFYRRQGVHWSGFGSSRLWPDRHPVRPLKVIS